MGSPDDAPVTKQPPVCPRCKWGHRLDASYELAGLVHQDAYCSYCGKRWVDPPTKPQDDDVAR
jgi:hypothetical protein